VQAGLFLLVVFGPRGFNGDLDRISQYSLIANITGGVLLMSGIIFVGTAVVNLGKNLTPMPVPKKDGTLIVNGAYRFVRHPIYSGIICMAFGWGFWLNSLLTVGYAFLLLVFFDIKSRYEERLLDEKFSEYSEYRKRVRKLLPFIY
jgi:protein-S-isoprenylcysteine O-methyltransferase Ste14